MIKTPLEAHTVKLRDSRRRPDVTPEGKESPLRKDLLKVLLNKPHDPNCRFYRAVISPVGVECKHGYDVCCECDPCTCQEIRPTCYLPSFCPPTCPPTCYGKKAQTIGREPDANDEKTIVEVCTDCGKGVFVPSPTKPGYTEWCFLHRLGKPLCKECYLQWRDRGSPCTEDELKEYGEKLCHYIDTDGNTTIQEAKANIVIPRDNPDWYRPTCPNCEDNLDCQCGEWKA